MSIVVTAADVYTAVDPTRSVAVIQRVGGGAYRLSAGGDTSEFKDYDSAVAAGEAFAADLEAESEPVDALEVRKLRARIVELEAQLATKLDVIAEPPVQIGR